MIAKNSLSSCKALSSGNAAAQHNERGLASPLAPDGRRAQSAPITSHTSPRGDGASAERATSSQLRNGPGRRSFSETALDADYFEKHPVGSFTDHAEPMGLGSGLFHVLSGQAQRHPWDPPPCPLEHFEIVRNQADARRTRLETLVEGLGESICRLGQRFFNIQSTWSQLEDHFNHRPVLALFVSYLNQLVNYRPNRWRDEAPEPVILSPLQTKPDPSGFIAFFEDLNQHLEQEERNLTQIRLAIRQMNYIFAVTEEILGQHTAGTLPTLEEAAAIAAQNACAAPSPILANILLRLYREAHMSRSLDAEQRATAAFWYKQLCPSMQPQ